MLVRQGSEALQMEFNELSQELELVEYLELQEDYNK